MARSQHDKIYVQREEQIEMTGDLKIENVILSQQLTLIQKQLKDITEQNKMLAHDKWILGQEKAQLFG